MSTEPTPPSRRKRLLWIWLAATVIIAAATFAMEAALNVRHDSLHPWIAVVTGLCAATVCLALLPLVHWFNNWRNLRRGLMGLAVFATLAAIFYTVENWRGKRVWERTKSEL